MFMKHFKRKMNWFLNVTIREYSNCFFTRQRRAKLKGTDFTIISNNCWGAHVYRYFGVPYNSPTIGLYFWPDSYLRFISNLDYYLAQDIKFIDYRESAHVETLIKIGQTDRIIGKLDDVEIVFLHYHSQEEVVKKWKRRVARVNKSHLLVKNSMQNGMTYDQVIEFDKIPIGGGKMIFVPPAIKGVKSAIVYNACDNGEQVTDDIMYFNKYINLIDWINSSYEFL